MDLNNLKDQVSNLSLYDLKAGVRKVQNAVMNYTEMEAKVREATNNEPWGASSTLMQEIANGTFHYAMLGEIMPMIYKRFTEKSAEEWRQIYKALQLLEFLVKNGSERVIDDARSHLSLLKMLRQFHYIDQNGKDQGINVRNRARELAELLSDVDRIRSERKKAKSTRNKYGGVEGGLGSMGGLSGGSGGRYGGFGSEDAGGYGGYSGGVYGDGGGFGGNTGGFQDSGGNRRERFEEYDEYDEGAVAAPGRRAADVGSSSGRKTEALPKKKEPEPDLFDFGEDDIPATTTAQPVASSSNGNGKQLASLEGLQSSTSGPANGDDDDFDDFQSATPEPQAATPAISGPTSTQFAAPRPVSGSQGGSLNGLMGFTSPPQSSTGTPSNVSAFSPPPAVPSQQPLNLGMGQQQAQPSFQQQLPKSTGYQAAQPNYFTSVQTGASGSGSTPGTVTSPSGAPAPTPAASTKKPAGPSGGGDAFGTLWSTASSGIKKSGTPSGSGANLASMAKEKASAGIWGAPSAAGGSAAGLSSPTPPKPSGSSTGASGNSGAQTGGGLDDLLC